MEDEPTSDVADLLAQEFEIWLRNLAESKAIPRAFTGVYSDGRQFVSILTGLPLSEAERRDFLIWLCEYEQLVAYAYITHVGIADETASAVREGIDIYASSSARDVSITFKLARNAAGKASYTVVGRASVPSGQLPTIFHGLQRAKLMATKPALSEYKLLWAALSETAMRRQR